MKHLACALLLSLTFPYACAQASGAVASARNPMADPFAANPRPEPPVRPAPRAVTPAPVAPARVTLPAGLRAILIRENGMGLLSTGEVGAPSIPVSHGRDVRIQDQDFRVEMTASSIRLVSAAAGRVVWEGALAGNAAQVLPPDISQMKYIPPLSAGVDPGLGVANAAGRAMPPVVVKPLEVR